MVLVSTIEGHLYALDGNDGGSVLWSIGTGPGPMLSSSIHNLEVFLSCFLLVGRGKAQFPSFAIVISQS